MNSNFDIDITNFQSITNGNLSFVPGVNVVVGQSNSGKTAILRAIKTNILNPKGSQRRIQHGKDRSEITIKYLGNEITWVRTPKESSYVINGEEFKKTGTSNVFNYLNDFGFVLDEKDGLMNIEGELQLPFPFDRNPQELFKLFENLLSVLKSSGVLKQFKALESSRDSEVLLLESEIDKYSTKYKAIKDLKEVVSIEMMSKMKEVLVGLVDTYKSKDADLQVLLKNKDLVLMADFKEFDVNMKEPLTKYINLVKDIKVCNSTKDLYKIIKGMPKCGLIDVSKYEELRKDILTCKRLQAMNNLLDNAPSPRVVQLVDYTNLRKDFNTLMRFKQEGKDCMVKLNRTKSEIEDIQERLKEFKVCPLCGKELD